MRHLNLILTALSPLLWLSPSRAAVWQPAAGPLKTLWAEGGSPASATPELNRYNIHP